MIGERLESFSQLRRRVYNKRLQRDHRRGARLDRGIACDLQLAHHLDHAIRSLRGRRGLTGQHGPGSDLGIDSVGLARRAARAPVTPIHLHNTMPCAAHRPGEAGAIAAGAFDAERFDPPVRVCPPDQGPIAPRIRHERVVAEAGPPRVDRDRNMDILMGVNADNHLLRLGLAVGHRCLLGLRSAGWPGWADRTVTGRECGRPLLGHGPSGQLLDDAPVSDDRQFSS